MKLFQFLKDIAQGNAHDNYSDDEVKKHVEALDCGYDEYLKKPKSYHDMVIKKMYKDTKYAYREPEDLRDILHLQITGTPRKKVS